MNILQIISLAMMSVGLCGAGFWLFLLARNEWVYRQRMALIDLGARQRLALGRPWSTAPRAYELLPSYDAMLYRFWVWDIRKFLPREAWPLLEEPS